ncbi:MAG: peptidase, partial [Bacteroidetes bacterium]|nr:peptidase [Bacteroidota bacterium]
DNYKLATYTQTVKYFKALAAACPDRAKLVDIGQTEEGRPQYMMIISSPANMQRLDEYKMISQKLARAEGLTEEEARRLAETGRAVVWIDGGIHATEVVGTHQLIETITQLLTRKDEETLRILDNCIILLAHINPDGQELVSNWYMSRADTLKRALDIPKVYNKYIGHDNNRDYFMMNMKETQNISRQLFVEWLPQIMYNHHQSGPPGSIVAGPPYRDPFNYVYDPALVTSLDAVGAAMNNRLNIEGKPGYTQRAGSQYSTWWNGGLRTAPYFHNMVGLLTEIIGGPTPMDLPFIPDRLQPTAGMTYPVAPQKWYFRQSIDYELSLNYAVLDYAARQRTSLLYNIYRMGRNSIEKGSGNTWTYYPRYIDSAFAMYGRDSAAKALPRDKNKAYTQSATAIPRSYYDKVFKNLAYADAQAYIIPSSQKDFPTATRFVNALILSGIKIMKATAPFTVSGKQYAAGSYIVPAAQAFRPHVMDMFERQDHPNDFEYPGGPPIKPYDATGWTLAYQMGVDFDKVNEQPKGNFAIIPYGEVQAFVPAAFAANGSKGYAINYFKNNAFLVVNDLLKAGIPISRFRSSPSPAIPIGSFYVAPSSTAESILKNAAVQYGLTVEKLTAKPGNLQPVTHARVGIWNLYGGSITAGWLQWMMEQYHFSDFSFVYSKEIDAGNLQNKYDILLFTGDAIPEPGQEKLPSRSSGPKEADLPAEVRDWTGAITSSKSIPVLRKFIEAGGTVITIGKSANLAYQLKLPVENYLVERDKNYQLSPLPSTRYYIPGAILSEVIDSTATVNWGMGSKTDVYFDNSPVFRIETGATQVKPLSWFDTDSPLRSGWAWGQSYLKNGVTSFESSLGKGKLVVFGPEIVFRAQSHAGFKRLFNTLYLYPNASTK